VASAIGDSKFDLPIESPYRVFGVGQWFTGIVIEYDEFIVEC
jgi:hypothetical protein